MRKIKKLVLCYYILTGFFFSLLGLSTDAVIQLCVCVCVYISVDTHIQRHRKKLI